ncbi:MAG: hypothetical protein DMG95_03640, partial [Acidobacteria bacterium]
QHVFRAGSAFKYVNVISALKFQMKRAVTLQKGAGIVIESFVRDTKKVTTGVSLRRGKRGSHKYE